MKRLLLDSPLIDTYADVERRKNFRPSLRLRRQNKRCTILAIYRPPDLRPCGLCGAYDRSHFLARFLGGLETTVGESCCAYRFTPDWSQQVTVAVHLDMLRSERATINAAIKRRAEHLERAYGMLADARRLRDAKLDFQHLYPDSLHWQIGLLVKHPRPEVLDGVRAWDGDVYSALHAAIALLDELHHIAFYDDDPDPEADSAGYIRAVASRCAGMSRLRQRRSSKRGCSSRPTTWIDCLTS
jgi:hypothetical protein